MGAHSGAEPSRKHPACGVRPDKAAIADAHGARWVVTKILDKRRIKPRVTPSSNPTLRAKSCAWPMASTPVMDGVVSP
jgi:hypothetical protein